MSRDARAPTPGSELQKLVLIIEDDEFVRVALGREMVRLGFDCRQAPDLNSARVLLQSSNPFDLVLSDIHLPDGNALEFLKSLKAKHANPPSNPPWIFITGDPSPDLVKKSTEAGGIDLLRKPFSRSDLRTLLERLSIRNQDPLIDITTLIEELSGIRLGEQKRMLVEGRVHQRARELNLNGVAAYLSYFKSHRSEEAQALLSLVSTHTTEFFREPDHFEFLCDRVLPELFSTRRPIRVWSAACSSGEEVYTIAMAIHNKFLSGPADSRPTLNSGLPMQIDILGTDLDPRSVQKANNGVYPVQALAKMPENFRARYTDLGKGDLAGWIRVRNSIHDLCRFQSSNLLAAEWPVKAADVIFLRNVLMYFPVELALKVVERMTSLLPQDGYLFLGHAESGLGLKAGLELVAPAVYRKRKS